MHKLSATQIQTLKNIGIQTWQLQNKTAESIYDVKPQSIQQQPNIPINKIPVIDEPEAQPAIDETNHNPSTEQSTAKIPAKTNNSPDDNSKEFNCCFLVSIHNNYGVSVVADITNKKNPAAEKALLINLINKLGINGKHEYQNIFSWPISLEYQDKNSAKLALSGLLSNWNNKKYLLVLGAVAFDLLAENQDDYQAGNSYKWQENTQMLTSFSAQDLLLNTSLRHETWQHLQPAKQ